MRAAWLNMATLTCGRSLQPPLPAVVVVVVVVVVKFREFQSLWRRDQLRELEVSLMALFLWVQQSERVCGKEQLMCLLSALSHRSVSQLRKTYTANCLTLSKVEF
jgi:hypothetical protein